MASAQDYFNSFDPNEQNRIRASWDGNPNGMQDWFGNAQAAGAVPAAGALTIGDLQASNVGQSEDYLRFQQGDIDRWAPYYDAGSGQFRSSRGAEGLFDKPTECPPGMVPSGPNETDPCIQPGAGGGGGGGGAYSSSGSGGWAGGTAGAVPQFNAPTFTPPSYEEAMNDPGYQFSLKQGLEGLQGSAAARGVLRTGGTLKDIIGYGQDRAAQQYGDVYNRAANTFGLNYQGAKDEFAPQYGGWQTMYGGDLSRYLQQQQDALSRWSTQYGGDLSKYLQKENNIYGLISGGAPAAPVWA